MNYLNVFTVKCPKGMYYNITTKTCKNCATGYISSQEGSLECEACPEISSTLVEGSKKCTGKFTFKCLVSEPQPTILSLSI